MKNLTVLISYVSVYLFMRTGVCSVDTHIVVSTKEHEFIEINTSRNIPIIEALAYINKHGMKMEKIKFSEDAFVARKDRYLIERKHNR